MFIGRSAQAILSTNALLHNIQIVEKYAPNSRIVAMIKANAYGHGIRQVAKRLADKVAMLGVVSIDEALIIRSVGVQTPILIVEGPSSIEELYEAGNRHYAMVIHCAEQLTWLSQYQGPKLNLWLMIDTGMNHLGFSLAKADSIYQQLQQLDCVKHVTLMSHFACSNTPEHPLHQQQRQHFSQLATRINTSQSLNNSAAIFHDHHHSYDYVRPGLALYGYLSADLPQGQELQPVMTLRSKVIAIRDLTPGQSIGYDALFTCTQAMKVAIIAMGYGDGYPLSNIDQFPVAIHGQIYHSVGKISMDRLVVDISHAKQSIQCGDWAELWGANNPLQNIAKRAQRSPYELLTGVQNRVRFHWQD